jgi:hypothetical protein
MKLSKFNVFLISLVIGGALALVGYSQYLKQKNEIQLPKLAERIKKEHNTPAAQLIFALHSSYNIETVAKNPEKVKELLKTKEELSVSDKAALNQLIEKVTTK